MSESSGPHRLIGDIHDGDLEAALLHRLRHLDADVSGADDDGTLGVVPQRLDQFDAVG